MDSSESVDDNLEDFLKITLQLSDFDYALDDWSIVMTMMNAMLDNYQPTKNVFQYTSIFPSYDSLCTAIRTRKN